MSRRLDVGIAVYSSPGLLANAIASIEKHSTTDYRLILIVNPHPDTKVRDDLRSLLSRVMPANPRIVVRELPENVGYAGAVNEILACSESEYIAYCDEDVEVLTTGWDETLCSYLDRFHEVGFIAPNGGAYAIQQPGYQEVLWAVGFCFVMPRIVVENVGFMDTTIGHQNEVDLEMRVRMGGYTIAAAPEVRVAHNATSSNDPAANSRIARGVESFVTKWTNYFGGKNLTYHSPNVLRFEDWHPTALHLERWWLLRYPELNANPEVITVEGRKYDLIKVPRLHGFYTNRII